MQDLAAVQEAFSALGISLEVCCCWQLLCSLNDAQGSQDRHNEHCVYAKMPQISHSTLRVVPCMQKQELAVSGRSWGAAAVEGSNLVFSVNGKAAFRVPLQDVGQVHI